MRYWVSLKSPLRSRPAREIVALTVVNVRGLAMPEWDKIYYWYIYKDAQNQWRWNFRAPNHLKIASSGEGYHNKSDCEHAIDLIKLHGPSAPKGYPANS
jgi:uncharacterized protein YegP (UPF0339 family)